MTFLIYNLFSWLDFFVYCFFAKQVAGCNQLMIPMLVSEQYPEGLGHTVKEVETHEALLTVSKNSFSMMVPEVEERMSTLCEGGIASIILCGMEVSVFFWSKLAAKFRQNILSLTCRVKYSMGGQITVKKEN